LSRLSLSEIGGIKSLNSLVYSGFKLFMCVDLDYLNLYYLPKNLYYILYFIVYQGYFYHDIYNVLT